MELIETRPEKDKLSELNLIAGEKAKESAAFEASAKYLNVGLSLLAPDCWEHKYELTLALHDEAA